MLGDVSYPETPIIIEDLHIIGNDTVQPFRAAAKKRIRSGHFSSLLVFMQNDSLSNFHKNKLSEFSIGNNTTSEKMLHVNKHQTDSYCAMMSLFRYLTLRNISVSDEALVHFLEEFSGVPLTFFMCDGVTLTGEGR